MKSTSHTWHILAHETEASSLTGARGESQCPWVPTPSIDLTLSGLSHERKPAVDSQDQGAENEACE